MRRAVAVGLAIASAFAADFAHAAGFEVGAFALGMVAAGLGVVAFLGFAEAR